MRTTWATLSGKGLSRAQRTEIGKAAKASGTVGMLRGRNSGYTYRFTATSKARSFAAAIADIATVNVVEPIE